MRTALKIQPAAAIRIWEAGYGVVRLLHNVRQREPLTIPEVLRALPAELRGGGSCGLVIAAQPQIVIWEGLAEVTAILLTQLFSTQQLSLQICNPALYDISGVRPELPPVPSIREASREACWLPCTVGAGPTLGLNSDWQIAFRNRAPAN